MASAIPAATLRRARRPAVFEFGKLTFYAIRPVQFLRRILLLTSCGQTSPSESE
jgi:hypothetical protein